MKIHKSYQYLQPTYVLKDIKDDNELSDFIMKMVFKRNIDYSRVIGSAKSTHYNDGSYDRFGENDYYLKDPKDRDRYKPLIEMEVLNLANFAYRHCDYNDVEINIHFGDYHSGNSYEYHIYIEK